MEDKPNIDVINPDQPSHSVDNLMTRLSIYGQGQMWRKIDTIIRVQGIAHGINSRSYQGISYFSLKGTNATLKVKCPTNALPAENQHIVVEGIPILKINRFNSGLDVELEGSPIAQLAPIEHVEEIIEIKKEQHTKLAQLLETTDLSRFVLLGTEMTLRDVATQMGQETYNQVQRRVITVSDKDSVLKSIRALGTQTSGFALVRGGADGTLKIWDDAKFVKKIVEFNIPFYVALGHAHQIGLIAQYADESFSTPSALGTAIKETLNRYTQFQNAQLRIDELNKELKQQASDLAHQYQEQAKAEHNRNKTELLKLKQESDAKFETLSKGYQLKLSETSKAQEKKIEKITKVNQEATSLINSETQKRTAELTQAHQAQIEKINTENEQKREASTKAYDARIDALSAQYQNQIKAAHQEKDQKIDQLINGNKVEQDKQRQEHNAAIAKLTTENKHLSIELKARRPSRPLYEWAIFGTLILIIIALIIKLF